MRKRESRLLWMCVILVLFLSISVNSEGVYEAWVARYNGPGNDYDIARAVTGGSDGTTYVTGCVECYTISGDYMTIKYGPDGDTIWTRRYDWAGDDDVAYLVATDNQGNVIVGGAAWYAETLDDISIVKYSPSGDTIWTRRYNGLTSEIDNPSSITTAESGNIYVSGVCNWVVGTSGDFLIIKYLPDGDTQWSRVYNGPANDLDAAYAIAVDEYGHVYATGSSRGIGTSSDYLTIKYSPAGDTEWVRRFSSPGDSYDIALDLAIDEDGNVYITGTSGTIKYSTNGDLLWHRSFADRARALAVDASGNVFVTGYKYNPATDMEYQTIKYGPDGDTLWVNYYNGSANLGDDPRGIVSDTLGNAYVTGWGRNTTTGYDYSTIKCSSSGELLWAKYYDGPASGSDEVYDLYLDDENNLFITGMSTGLSTGPDFATVKYSPCQGAAGNLNFDEKTDVVDLVYMVNIVFKSWSVPNSTCVADVNGDDVVKLGDVIYLANHVFKFGPAPIQKLPCCGD